MILRIDQVHPGLKDVYKNMVDIYETPQGLLKSNFGLVTYLDQILEVLGKRPIMFAHDITSGPMRLMDYARGEVKETIAEFPIAEKIMGQVDGRASAEAGDVMWFLAMAEAISIVNGAPMESNLPEEHLNAVTILSLFNVLQSSWPAFDPIAHASKVAKKNSINYPESVLQAPPEATVDQMSDQFEFVVYPALKALRKLLPDHKLPLEVSTAINMRESPPALLGQYIGAIDAYAQVLELAW